VASTAAGFEVTGSIGAGVAPGAELYALKVFGEPAGSTNLTISAIEWAMDPDGDGDLSDHVNVINMSLGSDFGPASDVDPVIVATNNASKIGIVVVAAAGNAGDTKYITGSPASADSAISVAASTTGYINGPTIDVLDTNIVTNTNIIYQPSSFSVGGQFTQSLTAELFYAGDLTLGSDDELCTTDGLMAGALSGKLALIQRGTCGFPDKVNNAASLGAVGAIVFNSEEGGNSRIIIGGDEVTIPAGFIAHDDGVSLVLDKGKLTTVSAEDDLSAVEDLYSEADTIAIFSSRGPRGYDSALKPDISAPGLSIKAAEMGGGTTGAVYNGTSMASPHIAGVAALVRDAHDDWNPEQVKAAIMNTAVDLTDDMSAEVSRQGSGRVNAYEAVTAEVLAIGDGDFVGLNWGVIPIYNDVYTDQKMISVQNTSIFTKVFSVTSSLAENSTTTGFALSVPLTIEVKGSPGFAYVPVDLTIDGSQVLSEFYTLEEYSGFVEFTNVDNSQEVVRVPFYAVPQPYSELMLTGSSLSGIYGTVDIEHIGPITSSLVAYPLYVNDGNEPAQGDEADIRFVGMDALGDFGNGPIFSLAIDVYGSWHSPQNMFTEFVLYLDVDQDDVWDYQVFNWNSGAATGLSDNDEWVLVKRDLSTNIYSIGSNYTIWTDYNTGYMEWWLPAYLYNLDPAVDTDFIFKLVGYDDSYFTDPNIDETDMIYFDYARAPFFWSFSNNPGPAFSNSLLTFWIEDSSGYSDSDPLGLMIVDYRGEPGLGQAYAHSFIIDKPYNIWAPLVLY
jgi:minor extracellular serine protease Vpr